MADSTITGLPSYPSFSGSDIVEVVKGGVNYRMPLQTILDNVPAGGGGGSGTVTSITASSPLTGGVITSSGSIGLGTVPVSLGGTGLTALGSPLQVLRTNSGATALEYATISAAARVPQFSVAAIGNLVTGTTPASLFQSPFSATGTRTIAANRLVAGSQLMGIFSGDIRIVSGDTLTITVTLGGTTILTGISSGATATITSPASLWLLRDFCASVLTGGATGGTRSIGTFVAAGATAAATLLAGYLSTAGGGATSTSVTINCTGTLEFDILASFSSANAGNLIRIDGGALFIDG